jgi:N-methylhydantoinase B
MHFSEPGCRNNPVEVLEAKSPMIIEHYGYRPDSGGPGKHRGGVGVSRAYRFTAASVGIGLVYKTSAPWAVAGGGEALPNGMTINPGTPAERRGSGEYSHLEPGDLLVNATGGGGGWGRAFERDPAAVARDVRNGFVSREAAASRYGVALVVGTFDVDEHATAELRAKAS